jgi:diketogulonate reductase-like aldo/keto reductase
MKLPKLIYGTAWKEDSTEDLVIKAIKTGFRGIDTANQRRHYNEEAVGSAISKSNIKREELFIQTKYTYPNGQDSRIPYDINADYKTQVRQSFKSSLKHLQVSHIDSYILHGPLGYGITQDDLEVWQEMESLHKEKLTKYIGVSNVDIEQLKILFEKARIKPKFVQNRCFAQQIWDKDVREFCNNNDIIYQGFSLLTANPFIIPKIKSISDKLKKTPEQIIFRFSKHIGILPLTGTTNQNHMKQDLELDFDLEDEDVKLIENMAVS